MRCRVDPIDGWGYYEALDGSLAPGFDAEITDAGVQVSALSKGWKGKALNGKYAGCYIELTPRHTKWSGVVVLHA